MIDTDHGSGAMIAGKPLGADAVPPPTPVPAAPRKKPARPGPPPSEQGANRALPVRPPVAVPPASAATDQSAPSAESARIWRQSPSWLVSLLVHMALVLALALLGLSLPEGPRELSISLSAESSVQALDELESADLLVVPLETQEPTAAPQLQPIEGAVDLPTDANVGDVAPALAGRISDVGQIESALTIAALGDNQANADLFPSGGQSAATFFGVKTKGRKFVFLVDNSLSMKSGRFETAVAELNRSIGNLQSHQKFYVIFYSDTAYELLHPQKSSLLNASPENKRRVQYWLDTVHLCFKTRGEKAWNRALELKPDVIYLLGDGAFTDKTLSLALASQSPRLTVHTLGFGMKPKDREGFESIAARFKGKFHEVAVAPAMVELDEQKQRPRNKSNDGVWGLTLGNEQGKPQRK